MPRLLCLVAAATLLPGGPVAAEPPPAPAADVAVPPASSAAPTAVPAATPSLTPAASPPATGKPTPAQQAVLDRIRRLRDGDQRRFGSCSYRWDRWKLHADGTRTTSYSCEASQIVDRTIGVNCSKLQINSYDPVPQSTGKGDAWAWGSWRLPQAGGEEQMVATLCANALPVPAAPPAAAGSSEARTGAAAPPATGKSKSPGAPGAGATPSGGR